MITVKNVKIEDGLVYLEFTCNGEEDINKTIYDPKNNTITIESSKYADRMTANAAARLSKRYLSGELQWKDKDYVYMWY